VTTRPRNIQQLITEWVCLTHAKHAREHFRGYDARHAQSEIDRERVIAEARAAAALATQYVTSERTASSVT
jgi:hypothetical protein